MEEDFARAAKEMGITRYPRKPVPLVRFSYQFVDEPREVIRLGGMGWRLIEVIQPYGSNGYGENARFIMELEVYDED